MILKRSGNYDAQEVGQLRFLRIRGKWGPGKMDSGEMVSGKILLGKWISTDHLVQ